jgi:hypothetical protein
MLATTLKELPKLPEDNDNFIYNWNYSNWILSDSKILYNGSTTKDPSPEEIESIISFLTEQDPSLSGIFSLSSNRDDELEYGSSNYFVSKGSIKDFDFQLMFELSQKAS